MSNWSLGARMGAAFAALVAAIGLALGLAIDGLQDNQRRFASVYRDRVEPLEQITEVRKQIGLAARVVMKPELSVPEARRQVVATFTVVDSIWARYLATYLTPEERDLVRATEPALGAVRTALDAVLDRGTEPLAPTAVGAVEQAVARATELLTDLAALQVRVAREEFVVAQAEAASRSRWSVGLSVIAVLSVFGFALYMYRGMIGRLHIVRGRMDSMGSVCIAGLRRGMQSMAGGHFDVDVQPKTLPIQFRERDELGALGASFDRALGDTQAIVAEYNRTRGTLATMSHRLGSLAHDLANGRLEARADVSALDGEFRNIAEAINRALDTVVAPMVRASEDFGTTFRRLAVGDLTVRPADTHVGVHAETAAALAGALTALDGTVSSVTATGAEIAAAAQEIAAGAEVQARALSDQAARIEEITAASSDMRKGARDVAHEATEARRCTEAATQATTTGTASLRALAEALTRMRASADSTARVVKTIDELAFQTNLLALNAAVEAARAGDAGRGFAVVAEEVRALATRSAEAARQTAGLIHASLEAVRDGSALGDRAVEDIAGIEAQVRELREHIERVAQTSRSQLVSLDSVGEALEAVNAITQQSAASAEETSAAAEELRGQSSALTEQAGRFRVSECRDTRRGVRRVA